MSLSLNQSVLVAAFQDCVEDILARHPNAGPRQKFKLARQLLCMSQRDFSNHFRIPIDTVRNWEADSRPEPSGAAKLFIDLLFVNPAMIAQMATKVAGVGSVSESSKTLIRQLDEVS